jgi:hypothetical protein
MNALGHFGVNLMTWIKKIDDGDESMLSGT